MDNCKLGYQWDPRRADSRTWHRYSNLKMPKSHSQPSAFVVLHQWIQQPWIIWHCSYWKELYINRPTQLKLVLFYGKLYIHFIFFIHYLDCFHILKVLVTQSRLSLCDPMDCGPLGSSVHGILQARILEWIAFSFSRGSSWPRDRICIS